MLTEREINEIAINHANISKTDHYYLEFLSVKPSAFLDGYWDASFKVFTQEGTELEGPLLIAIDGETGEINTMEQLIMKHSKDSRVKISNQPIKNIFNTSIPVFKQPNQISHPQGQPGKRLPLFYADRPIEAPKQD